MLRHGNASAGGRKAKGRQAFSQLQLYIGEIEASAGKAGQLAPKEALAKLKRRARHRSLEFGEQCALFEWARLPVVQDQYPGLDLLSPSLNGLYFENDAIAAKAKKSGLLPGEFDVKLPVARGGYHGFIFELKQGYNKLTAPQEWYGGRMREEGWLVGCYWSWTDARDAIVRYLRGQEIKAE